MLTQHKPSARHLLDALRLQSQLRPTKIAFLILDAKLAVLEQICFGQLYDRVLERASALHARGLGDRNVPMLQPTSLEFIFNFFGLIASGGCAVPLNPRTALDGSGGLDLVAADCGAPAILADTATADRLARASRPSSLEIEVLDGQFIPHRQVKAPRATTDDDIALIQYTSGSISAPKGVRITHRNLLSNVDLLTRTFAASHEDVVLSWLPLFHDMGLMTGLVWPAATGATSVLMRPSTFAGRPSTWLRALSDHRATVSSGPNFAFQACADRISEEELVGLDLSSWRVAICGGEPIRAQTQEQFCERFAPVGFRSSGFYPSYGLAEATLFVSGGRSAGAPEILRVDAKALDSDGLIVEAGDTDCRKVVSCGEPGYGVDVRIVEPSCGRALQENAVGEIWLAGPSVSPGYLNRSTETVETFGALLTEEDTQSINGPRFLRTGDLGFLRNGLLYVTGRLKDLIIVRGVKFWPQDLELTAGAAHPAIETDSATAFVIGPDESPRVVIVQEIGRSRREMADEVIEAIRAQVARFHGLSLDVVVLIASRNLPRTSSGKVRRRHTRSAWLAGELSVVKAWSASGEKAAPSTHRLAKPIHTVLDESIAPGVRTLVEELERDGVQFILERDVVRTRGRLSANAIKLAELKRRKAEVTAFLAGRQAQGTRDAEMAIKQQIAASMPGEFATVGSQDFLLMLDRDRYVSRSRAFDGMIRSSQLHYWDPLDARYLDLDVPFDIKTTPILRETGFLSLKTPTVSARLSAEADRTRFINRVAWVRFSTLLHGEQGALNLSASLCGMLKDQGAQEFVANQVREEARHVTAFASYIHRRWGRPAPCMPVLRDFLAEIVRSDDAMKKIVGMQVMVEGLAMGSLASLYAELRDPVGQRLVQLVMTDEAFHHKFGRMWCDLILPALDSAARARLEAWTTHCLRDFIVKMNPPTELFILKQEFGLDPVQVAREMAQRSGQEDAETGGTRRTFRVLTRILREANLLSEQTRATYGAFLQSEMDTDAPDNIETIVADGLAFLREMAEGQTDVR